MKIKFGIYIDTMIFCAIFFGFISLLEGLSSVSYYLMVFFVYLLNVILYAYYNRVTKTKLMD